MSVVVLLRPCVLRALLTLTAAPLLMADDAFTAQRLQMVREQIENRGIRDAGVLRVMRATPRHLFVPADVQSRAYADTPLPIGHSATISQPYVVARMTGLLEPRANHRVLEIGTGSGYQAAVLSQLVKRVYSIEIVPELAQQAAQTLRSLGYLNITVRHGDGYKGWPEEAPFDRIIVTAAPPEIPQALVNQLANGGRLVAPVGSAWAQELVLVEKGMDGRTHRHSAGAVAFVPMKPGK